MNVLHLDLPRGFTMTVKEYLTEVDAAVRTAGCGFEQHDTNPVYWRWLFGLRRDPGEELLFDQLVEPGLSSDPWQVLQSARNHFRQIEESFGVSVGFRGMNLPGHVKNSSLGMCEVLAGGFGEEFFEGFFSELDARYHLLNADVLSLGVTYQEGVFWSLALAAWVKARNPQVHIVLSRHTFGNFSLVHHVDALMENPVFFRLIDSLVPYQEDLPETIVKLAAALEGAPVELHNIVLARDGSVTKFEARTDAGHERRVADGQYVIPDGYFASMDVPRGEIVYSTDLVRNKCFYRQCNFCTQIHHHVADVAFSPSHEIERALAAADQLNARGVNMINYQDEAMRVRDLRALTEGLSERDYTGHWVGRMIAAAVPDDDLLGAMKDSGCTEILFGVETFDPDHAATLGKISGKYHSPQEITDVITSFLDQGLFVFLSMIIDFPTETKSVRELDLQCLREVLQASKRVSMYINHYALFQPSAVFSQPGDYGIEIESRSPREDLRYSYSYRSDREGLTADEVEQFDAVRFGLSLDEWRRVQERVGEAALEDLYFLDCGSFGFSQRVRTGRTMLEEPLRELLFEAEAPAVR